MNLHKGSKRSLATHLPTCVDRSRAEVFIARVINVLFFVVRTKATSQMRAYTFAHISKHPCLPENLHGFPHTCWLATHLQRDICHCALSHSNEGLHVFPRVARTIATYSVRGVRHHDLNVTHLIIHGQCSPGSSAKQKSHSCTHKWSDRQSCTPSCARLRTQRS